jgi:hypothetical protein
MNPKNNSQNFGSKWESSLPYLCYISKKPNHKIYACNHQTKLHAMFRDKTIISIVKAEPKKRMLWETWFWQEQLHISKSPLEVVFKDNQIMKNKFLTNWAKEEKLQKKF